MKKKKINSEEESDFSFEDSSFKDFFDKIEDEEDDNFSNSKCGCGCCPECSCDCGADDCEICCPGEEADENEEEFDDDEFYDAELEDVQGEFDEEPDA